MRNCELGYCSLKVIAFSNDNTLDAIEHDEKSIDFLKRLKEMNTSKSRKIVQKAKNDSDFDKIQNNSRFIDFMSEL